MEQSSPFVEGLYLAETNPSSFATKNDELSVSCRRIVKKLFEIQSSLPGGLSGGITEVETERCVDPEHVWEELQIRNRPFLRFVDETSKKLEETKRASRRVNPPQVPLDDGAKVTVEEKILSDEDEEEEEDNEDEDLEGAEEDEGKGDEEMDTGAQKYKEEKRNNGGDNGIEDGTESSPFIVQ